MRPVQTPECTLKYELPGGTEENDLPCERVYVDAGENRVVTVIRSTWELDTDDLVQLARSHRIELSIWGEPIPPVALTVLPQEGVEIQRVPPDPPIARAHLRRAVGLLVEKLVEMGEKPAPPEDVFAGLEQCLIETQVQ